MQKIKPLLIGATGLVSTEVSPEIINTVTSDAPNVIQIVVQLVIAIATLVKMFKKSKNVNP